MSFLKRSEFKACYALIRHNVRTYKSGGVVEVIRGRLNAEMTLRQFEAGQVPEDRQAGWGYFLEKTKLKAGTDPAQATHLRQTELENRESRALQESNDFLSGRAILRSEPYT